MRSILSALDTAQKQPSREPYIPVVIHNRWEAVRRWDFATLNTTTNANAKHDVAVAADGSVTRVRIEAGNLKGQRVTAPLTPASWDSWSNYATGIGAQCAAAGRGTAVAVVYTDAAGTGVYLIESADSGATFGAPFLVDTAASAVQDVAVTYKANGDLGVAWVLATTLRFRRRVSGVWGGAISHPTTQSNLNGIALAHNGDWSMLVTGDAAGTTLGTVWTTAYGDGLDLTAGVFGSWLVQFQSDSSTAVTAYQAPFLTHDGTSFRASFVEVPFYTGGVTRTYWTYLHPDLSWVIGSFGWRSPVPTDHHVTTGLALASDGAHVYASGTTIVRRASVAALTLDVTADVLALSLDEEQFDGGGWIDLDNTGGAYAGPPAPLQLGALVLLSMGYRTASGLQASRLQDLWVEGWEYRRTGGVGVLRVYVETAWRRLRRQRNRTVIYHAASTYRTIIGAILARAGLAINIALASSRYSLTSQRFVIDPRDSGETALRRALAFVADRVVLRANGSAAIIEPLTGEFADFDLPGGGYPVRGIALGPRPVPVSEAHAISQSGSSLIAAPATDYAYAEYGQGELEQLRDAASTSAIAAGATATAHLRQRALDRREGRLDLQPIVNLEIFDVLEFGDTTIHANDQLRRVYGIRWRYDRGAGRFDQAAEIGPL